MENGEWSVQSCFLRVVLCVKLLVVENDVSRLRLLSGLTCK